LLIIPPPKYRKRRRIEERAAAAPPPPSPVVVDGVNVGGGDDMLTGIVEGVLPGTFSDPTGFAADGVAATGCYGTAGQGYFIIEGPEFAGASEVTYDGTGAAASVVQPFDLPTS
jgi:hypothetical protein